jgi:hypothetical protein
MMTQRQCPYTRCKVLTDVNTEGDVAGLGAIMTKFCPFHDRVYHRSHVLFRMMGKKIGKDSVDMSNDLWRHNKRAWNKVEKRAIVWVKKHG